MSMRLERYLQRKRLRIHPIVGDGNCLFRALADQLNEEQNHLEIRRAICYHMKTNPENFRKFLTSNQTFEEYIYSMSQPNTWGDNLCIQAFCDIYGIDINIVEVTPYEIREILIEPRIFLYRNHYNRIIHLLFDGLHYDSLRRY